MFIFLILLLLPPPPAASPASLLFPNFLFKWTHYLIPPPPPPPPPSALSRYQASDYFSRNIINQSGKYRLRSIHRNRRRDGEFQGGPLSVAIGLGIYLGLCVSLCVCVCVCVLISNRSGWYVRPQRRTLICRPTLLYPAGRLFVTTAISVWLPQFKYSIFPTVSPQHPDVCVCVYFYWVVFYPS